MDYLKLMTPARVGAGIFGRGVFPRFQWMKHISLYACARYVELNPVRAGLVKEAWHYRWSSAAAHLAGRDDILLRAKPLLEMYGDWRKCLNNDISPGEIKAFE